MPGSVFGFSPLNDFSWVLSGLTRHMCSSAPSLHSPRAQWGKLCRIISPAALGFQCLPLNIKKVSPTQPTVLRSWPTPAHRYSRALTRQSARTSTVRHIKGSHTVEDKSNSDHVPHARTNVSLTQRLYIICPSSTPRHISRRPIEDSTSSCLRQPQPILRP